MCHSTGTDHSQPSTEQDRFDRCRISSRCLETEYGRKMDDQRVVSRFHSLDARRTSSRLESNRQSRSGLLRSSNGQQPGNHSRLHALLYRVFLQTLRVLHLEHNKIDCQGRQILAEALAKRQVGCPLYYAVFHGLFQSLIEPDGHERSITM